MQFKDGSFDCVIDKGLMDAMVCSDGATGNIQSMLSEIYRVLSDKGVYICISHGKEDQRKKYLKNLKKYNWDRVKHMIQKPGVGAAVKEMKVPKEDDKKNFHFIYIMRK